MTDILLTRHGHVEGIDPIRFRGRHDVPLSKRGEKEARAIAGRIAAQWKPAIVYTSPLRRCTATADAIAAACRIRSAVLDSLIDLDYGAWQWKTYKAVQEESPHLFETWFEAPHLVRFPDGDSLQNLIARTAEAIRTVCDRHPTESVVLVGHDSVNRTILMQLLDQPLSAYWRLDQDLCCLNRIELTGRRVRVAFVNDTSHHR